MPGWIVRSAAVAASRVRPALSRSMMRRGTAIAAGRSRPSSVKQRFGAERHGQVEPLSHLQPEELRRRDADDRERNTFDVERPPDDAVGSFEPPLPQPVADDSDGAVWTAATSVVGRRECAAEERANTQRREEVAADDEAVDRLRLAVGCQVDTLRRPRDRAVECVGALAEAIPHRVVPAETCRESHSNRGVRRNRDQALGLLRRQRAQQQTIQE